MELRAAVPADFAQILALNAESVRFLSPLTPARLTQLHEMAAFHQVVVNDEKVVAFLLALREGRSYDSPNYRWFAARYERFLYIDRVVVARDMQGRGIGRLLYNALFAQARRTDGLRVACEFDVEPPNPVSRRFHEQYGFVEVGRQRAADGSKTVAMQIVPR